MTGRALVVRGDARALPLPDASVDLVVTSPPFYSLRSYTDGGVHYPGQIGSEATPAEYIATLLDCTREWVRVLKPSGSLFVNLGDRYTGGGGQSEKDERPDPHRLRAVRGTVPTYGRTYGMAVKSLMGLPWRYALGCVDQLGLILRAEIVWHKPNGLPESVTDRVRRSHEQWFHLVRQPRYYAAVDEIREPHTGNSHWYGAGASRRLWASSNGGKSHRSVDTHPSEFNPLGKLPGSVWTIPTEPLRVPDHLGIDHFAAFPLAWPLRLIAGWSPPGICTGCGEGRRPVVDVRYQQDADARRRQIGRIGEVQVVGHKMAHGNGSAGLGRTTTITGYACACPQPTAPTRPSVIVDPFGGTGTTALAARALGRAGISIDRSADYCRLAAWRTTDPGELAKAMRVEKPAVQVVGQTSLFDAEVV